MSLADGGTLSYDYLVIAAGVSPRPDQTPGMLGSQWRRSIFDFDTLDGAQALAGALAEFDGGRVIVHITDLPVDYVEGRQMAESFDGQANCFIESGDGRGMLIDFDYDSEPLTGRYPLPVVGPFRLLEETRANHLGKLAFRWMYWHVLLPRRPIPLTARIGRPSGSCARTSRSRVRRPRSGGCRSPGGFR